MFGLDWPAGVKMAVNIAAASALSLASYQLLVRHTAVSVLLNENAVTGEGGRHRAAHKKTACVSTGGNHFNQTIRASNRRHKLLTGTAHARWVHQPVAFVRAVV